MDVTVAHDDAIYTAPGHLWQVTELYLYFPGSESYGNCGELWKIVHINMAE